MNNDAPKNLAAYYAILATTEAATQATNTDFFQTDTADSQLKTALEEIATLRAQVAALKADNAGLTKALYDKMAQSHH
jgi:hypothetical protein